MKRRKIQIVTKAERERTEIARQRSLAELARQLERTSKSNSHAQRHIELGETFHSLQLSGGGLLLEKPAIELDRYRILRVENVKAHWPSWEHTVQLTPILDVELIQNRFSVFRLLGDFESYPEPQRWWTKPFEAELFEPDDEKHSQIGILFRETENAELRTGTPLLFLTPAKAALLSLLVEASGVHARHVALYDRVFYSHIRVLRAALAIRLVNDVISLVVQYTGFMPLHDLFQFIISS